MRVTKPSRRGLPGVSMSFAIRSSSTSPVGSGVAALAAASDAATTSTSNARHTIAGQYLEKVVRVAMMLLCVLAMLLMTTRGQNFYCMVRVFARVCRRRALTMRAQGQQPHQQQVQYVVVRGVFPVFFSRRRAAQELCFAHCSPPSARAPLTRTPAVCTANDVSISNIQRVGGASSCTIGSTVTVDIAVLWQSTAAGRYDVSTYIARDGGDALTGQCNQFILSPVTQGTPTLGSQSSPSQGPFPDLNNDQCGDLSQGQQVWQRIDNVVITCRDSNKVRPLAAQFFVPLS